MKYRIQLLALISLALVISSCKKDETTDSSVSTQRLMLTESSLSESMAEDASSIVDEAYHTLKVTKSSQGQVGLLKDSVIVTLKPQDSMITIDFGTNGITGNDGKTRKGKIILTFKNGYRKSGSSHRITFDNYSVDGVLVQGSRLVTYNGLNTSQNHYWTVVDTINLTYSSGAMSSFVSTRQREMIAGSSTPLNWLDDEYKITGSKNGTTTTGVNYTITSSTGIIIKVKCKTVQSGILTYTQAGAPPSDIVTIDYGYGSATPCDSQAKLTFRNVDYIINL